MFTQINHGFSHEGHYNPMMKRNIVDYNKMQDIESAE